MEIDLENAMKAFLEFTEKFNLEDKNIKRKQLHSLRVMLVSEEIAKRLDCSKEEVQLATLIGLLHDIGRFKQYTAIGLGDTIKGFDHGDYGVKILNTNMRDFIKTDKYDDIIKKAIKNHNKYKIEDGLNEKELLFAKIIRDADKIDILYECKDIFWKNEEEQVNKSEISEYIYEQFRKQKLIEKEQNKRYYGIDGVILALGYTFDINYKESYKIIKESNYIQDIIKRFKLENKDTNKKVNEMIKILNNYIEMQIKERE